MTEADPTERLIYEPSTPFQVPEDGTSPGMSPSHHSEVLTVIRTRVILFDRIMALDKKSRFTLFLVLQSMWWMSPEAYLAGRQQFLCNKAPIAA